ncbi:MAG: hypothetical protein JST10_12075, partial [Bacteroidetes bacterium]|nr:hypothetical protein [Bacteroidota bacterium]
REIQQVNYIRLEFKGGQTCYLPVSHVQGNWLELQDDPGFILEPGGKVRYHTFPLDELDGPLQYSVFVK